MRIYACVLCVCVCVCVCVFCVYVLARNHPLSSRMEWRRCFTLKTSARTLDIIAPSEPVSVLFCFLGVFLLVASVRILRYPKIITDMQLLFDLYMSLYLYIPL